MYRTRLVDLGLRLSALVVFNPCAQSWSRQVRTSIWKCYCAARVDAVVCSFATKVFTAYKDDQNAAVSYSVPADQHPFPFFFAAECPTVLPNSTSKRSAKPTVESRKLYVSPGASSNDSKCCLLTRAFRKVANRTLSRLRLYPICSQGGRHYCRGGIARTRVSGFKIEIGCLGQVADFYDFLG